MPECELNLLLLRHPSDPILVELERSSDLMAQDNLANVIFGGILCLGWLLLAVGIMLFVNGLRNPRTPPAAFSTLLWSMLFVIVGLALIIGGGYAASYVVNNQDLLTGTTIVGALIVVAGLVIALRFKKTE